MSSMKYPYRDLGVNFDRQFRNDLNANFDDIEHDIRMIGGEAAQQALEAAEEANTQAIYAQTSGDYANDKGDYAAQQGDYAQTQGNFANAKGLYAQQQGDYAKAQGDYAKQVGDENKTRWLTAVNTYADIAATYPNPQLGDTVQTIDDSKIYRWDGTQWVWTQQYNANAITDVQNKIGILNKKTDDHARIIRKDDIFLKELSAYNSGWVIKSGGYNHFGTAIKLPSGRLVIVYRKGVDHIGNDGRTVCIYSDDGGRTWSDEVEVYNHPSFGVRIGVAGVTKTGRIIVAHSIIDETNESSLIFIEMGVSYSDDGGLTWTYTKICDSTKYGFALPYGRLVVFPDNRLMFGFYTYTSTQKAMVIFSNDDGVTWGNGTVVYSGSDDINEMDYCLLYSDVVLGISRVSGGNTPFRQFISKDGGATWTDMGSINATDANIVAPSLNVFTSNGVRFVALFYHDRNIGYVKKRVCRVGDVLNTATKWREPKLIGYLPNTSGYQSAIDFGDLFFIVSFKENTATDCQIVAFVHYKDSEPFIETDWFAVAPNTTYNIEFYNENSDSYIGKRKIKKVTILWQNSLPSIEGTGTYNHIYEVVPVVDATGGHGAVFSVHNGLGEPNKGKGILYIRTGSVSTIKTTNFNGGVSSTGGYYKVLAWV